MHCSPRKISQFHCLLMTTLHLKPTIEIHFTIYLCALAYAEYTLKYKVVWKLPNSFSYIFALIDLKFKWSLKKWQTGCCSALSKPFWIPSFHRLKNILIRVSIKFDSVPKVPVGSFDVNCTLQRSSSFLWRQRKCRWNFISWPFVFLLQSVL